MMTWAKRIWILKINVNKLFSFFQSRCFLKDIENMFSVFLSCYRNTRESLGELEKWLVFPNEFFARPNFHLCFYNSLYNNPSYTRILIGSQLWSIRGKMHDWHHHYIFPSAILKLWLVVIFLDQSQFFATHSNQWSCFILYRS